MSDDFLKDLESQLHAAAVRRAAGPATAAPRRRRAFALPRLVPIGVGLAVAVLAVVMVSRFGSDAERSVPVGAPPAGECAPSDELLRAVPYLKRQEPGPNIPDALAREFPDAVPHMRGFEGPNGTSFWIHPRCDGDEVCMSAYAGGERREGMCGDLVGGGFGLSKTFSHEGRSYAFGVGSPETTLIEIGRGDPNDVVQVRPVLGTFGADAGPGGDTGLGVEFVRSPGVKGPAPLAVLDASGVDPGIDAFDLPRLFGVPPKRIVKGYDEGPPLERSQVYDNGDAALAGDIAAALGRDALPADPRIRQLSAGSDVVLVVGRDFYEVAKSGTTQGEIQAEPVTPDD